MNPFEKIYDKNKWLFGSGEGSLAKYTKKYRVFLENFLVTHQIKSVLDFGCGDWQFSKFVDWNGIKYHGVDIVKSIIDNNQKKYQTDLIKFSVIDSEYQPEAADLFIAKDVFQHWSNEKIKRFLPNLKKYKYVLMTNCGDLPQFRNVEIPDGGFRTLDLSAPPFSLKGEYIFSFRTRPVTVKNVLKWLLPNKGKGLDYNNKKVLLIDNTH